MHKPRRMQARILTRALLFFAVFPTCAQMQESTVVQTSSPASQSTDANAPGQSGQPGQSDKAAYIAGTVLSASTGSPLRRARIVLQVSSQTDIPRGAVTDESGHFSIGNISPGEYALSAQHDGYIQQRYGQDKPGKHAETLTLAAGQKIEDMTFHLQQAAVITGHVYNEDGDPIENANVEVVRIVYVQGKRQLASQQSVTTNDRGEYRIYDLGPGHYYVRAARGGSGFFNTLTEGEVVYPAVFYPNAASFDGATPLDLKPGDEIPSVDFQLTPNNSNGYEVAGKVIGSATGKAGASPASRSVVTIGERTSYTDVLQNERQVTTNPGDGTFKFSNITPGTYRLEAIQDENGQREIAMQEVIVSSANVANLSLVMTPGVDISGRITFEGKGANAGQVGVGVTSVTDDFLGGGASAQVQPDGSFDLKNVPDGTYRLQVWSMCETCYLKSASSRGTDLMGKSFDVQSGVAPSAVEIVFSADTAEASGTVNGDDDKPAGGAIVIAVPVADTPNRDARYKTSTTDQYGHFDLKGLAPGDYDVIALSDFDEDSEEYMDPMFLQPYADKAQRLRVAANDRKSLQLNALAASADSQ